MTAKKTYAEKLKDPRWQKLRLEVLERDGWECQRCFSKDKELQVHHLAYHNDPWDSELHELETLCKDCHQAREDIQKRIIAEIRKIKTIDAIGYEGCNTPVFDGLINAINVHIALNYVDQAAQLSKWALLKVQERATQ